MSGPELVEHYRRHGFCLMPSGLSESDHAMLVDVVTRLSDEPPRSGGIKLGEDRQFLSHPHEDIPELAEFVLGERQGSIGPARTQPTLPAGRSSASTRPNR